MCSLPDCDVRPKKIKVKPTIGRPVILEHCPSCDVRTCEQCKTKVPDGKAKHCPNGHWL